MRRPSGSFGNREREGRISRSKLRFAFCNGGARATTTGHQNSTSNVQVCRYVGNLKKCLTMVRINFRYIRVICKSYGSSLCALYIVTAVILARRIANLAAYTRLNETPEMPTGRPKSGNKHAEDSQESGDGIVCAPQCPIRKGILERAREPNKDKNRQMRSEKKVIRIELEETKGGRQIVRKKDTPEPNALSEYHASWKANHVNLGRNGFRYLFCLCGGVLLMAKE